MIKAILTSTSDALQQQTTGFVLAGGSSSRMGQDKAQISWGSGTLLTHAVQVLSRESSGVFVVGATLQQNSQAPVLPDSFPGRGPIAGIHAALAHTKTDWNLVLAVDLPLVTGELFRFMRLRCEEGSLAVVPRIGEYWQPLCGVYHRTIIEEVENELANGLSSIHRLLERLSAGMMEDKPNRIRAIDDSELLAGGFSLEIFANVNTPQELQRARTLAGNLHVN